jgi:hypothetical protein
MRENLNKDKKISKHVKSALLRAGALCTDRLNDALLGGGLALQMFPKSPNEGPKSPNEGPKSSNEGPKSSFLGVFATAGVSVVPLSHDDRKFNVSTVVSQEGTGFNGPGGYDHSPPLVTIFAIKTTEFGAEEASPICSAKSVTFVPSDRGHAHRSNGSQVKT